MKKSRKTWAIIRRKLIDIDPQILPAIEEVDKNITVITVFHLSKKVDKRLSMYRDMENTKKTQIEILEIKTISTHIHTHKKNALDGMNIKLDKVE